MWRSLVAIVLVYGTGHPSLDGYRPPLLDRPLLIFHQNVNDAAHWGHKALSSIDGAGCMRYLKFYVARVEAQLRGSGGSKE